MAAASCKVDDAVDNGELAQLWTAAKVGDVQMLGRATAGASDVIVNAADGFGNTALYYAAHHGHLACIKMLLSRYAL